MSKKDRCKLLKLAMAYLFFFVSSFPFSTVYGAASGNYSDLLPIGAAGNTTVISNGSGWSLTTLPTSQTFGDALSRLSYNAYQGTSTVTISNTAAVSTFTASGYGKVGSASFPYNWIATGRTIRVSIYGLYTSSSVATTWTWTLKLGTTTILNTGAVSIPAGQTKKPFKAVALMTIAATGSSGSINGSYDISVSSGTKGASTTLWLSTYTTTATSCDLSQTSNALTVKPTFKWGTASSASSLIANNILIEFLN